MQKNEQAFLPYIKGTVDQIGRILRKDKSNPQQQTIGNIPGNPKVKVQLD